MLGFGVTGRPRAAATRPPWAPCAGLRSPSPSAAAPRTASPGRLEPARGRPGRDRSLHHRATSPPAIPGASGGWPVGRCPCTRTPTHRPRGADHHDPIRCMTLRTPRKATHLGHAAARSSRPPSGWARAPGSCAGWCSSAASPTSSSAGVRIAARDLDAFIRAGRVEVGQFPTLTRRGLIMATIRERRVRNGRTTYRARYRDPAGMQRSRCSPARPMPSGS